MMPSWGMRPLPHPLCPISLSSHLPQIQLLPFIYFSADLRSDQDVSFLSILFLCSFSAVFIFSNHDSICIFSRQMCIMSKFLCTRRAQLCSRITVARHCRSLSLYLSLPSLIPFFFAFTLIIGWKIAFPKCSVK